jgi:hypothetical protein
MKILVVAGMLLLLWGEFGFCKGRKHKRDGSEGPVAGSRSCAGGGGCRAVVLLVGDAF